MLFTQKISVFWKFRIVSHLYILAKIQDVSIYWPHCISKTSQLRYPLEATYPKRSDSCFLFQHLPDVQYTVAPYNRAWSSVQYPIQWPGRAAYLVNCISKYVSIEGATEGSIILSWWLSKKYFKTIVHSWASKHCLESNIWFLKKFELIHD